MGRRPLAAEAIEQTRERIVEVATRLFAERGYAGVTFRALAEGLGCSPMTPYRYFRDKAAIFAAVRCAAHHDFASAQERAAAGISESAERLAALGRAYVHFGLEHRDAYRLMFELSQPSPDGFPELRAAELRSWTPLRSAVEAAVEAGALDGEPDVLANLFWSGVHGIVSLHLAGKLVFGANVDSVLQPMLRTLFVGNAASDDRASHGHQENDVE